VYDIPGGLQQDGIHATAKGNAIVAEDVFALLKPLLKK
jgi:lysophospholipase L1-like esterase